MHVNQLYQTPNALAPHYQQFRVSERILLTGHAHQAWPDCSQQAHLQAWEDAAEWVDAKWSRALERAERVQQGYAQLLNDPSGHYNLGSSTHELLTKFLSALPWRRRRKLITTDGEFFTIQRQLRRLSEEQIEVQWLPCLGGDDVIEQLCDAIDETVAAVLVSSVFYHNGQIIHPFTELLRTCQQYGVYLLIDIYHQLNVVPLDVTQTQLENAYLIGGGYKYCQLGEGNCFLRTPKDCQLRPVITGWFSEHESLVQTYATDERIAYGDGAMRFAGATYDPTSHYRATRVFDFFAHHQLTPKLLREVSQHQVQLIRQAFDDSDFNPSLIDRESLPLAQTGGFVTLHSPHASPLKTALANEQIHIDVKANTIRLGPAPYLSDAQLLHAMHTLKQVINKW